MSRTYREKNDGRKRSLRKRRYHFVQNPQQKIRVCCRSYSDPNFSLVLVEISCSPADGEQCNAKIKLEIHLWKGILLRASVIPCIPMSRYPSLYRAKTFTTPSPPALTTHRPSWLHTTEHTPSPLIRRWLVISWVQLLVSRLQNRRLASCPAETSSRPSGESDSAEIAAG
jgi:hypothetical protein